jgi:DNA-binding CsgD family transcriptional regulator
MRTAREACIFDVMRLSLTCRATAARRDRGIVMREASLPSPAPAADKGAFRGEVPCTMGARLAMELLRRGQGCDIHERFELRLAGGPVPVCSRVVEAAGETVIVLVMNAPCRMIPGHRALRFAFGLTPRQSQTAALMADGHSNKAIGKALQVSAKTAERYAEDVLRKLGVSGRGEVREALRPVACESCEVAIQERAATTVLPWKRG